MIVVGVGVRASATVAALHDAVAALDLPDVDVIATVDHRASHPAVVALARGRTLRTFSPEALAEVDVPAPSGRVERLAGTASVAEAAALLAAREHGPGARLVVGKTVGDGVTVAAAAVDQRDSRPVIDLDAEVARAVSLRTTTEEHQPSEAVRVMRDPHGHVLCLFLTVSQRRSRPSRVKPTRSAARHDASFHGSA